MFSLIALLLANAPAETLQSAAMAQRYTKAYHACMDNGDAGRGVQPAMNGCAFEEYQRQDAALNQIYGRVMKARAAPGKAKLRTAQRIWIKKRDGICITERDKYEGGSIAPLVYFSCMSDETIKRTIWLEKQR